MAVTKKQVSNLLSGLIILLLIIGFFAPSSDSLPEYKLLQTDFTQKQVTYRMRLEQETKKDELINLARHIKDSLGWDNKFVCFFTLSDSPTDAWASVAYLPKCDDCATDEDTNGNPVQFHQIVKTNEE